MRLPELHTRASQSVCLSRNSDSPNHAQLIQLLFRVTGILILIHLINLISGEPSWQIERLFSLGEENNIPTWFSSGLWALNAFTAYRCSTLTKTKKDKSLWVWVAVLFLAFSIDEVAMIHENLFGIMSRYFSSKFSSGILSYFKASNWPIIAVPFFIVTLVWLIFTFKRLLIFRPAGKLVVLGFFLVILGGYGLEITTNFLNHNELQWVWEVESVVEESFEMIGALFILSGLFKHFDWLNIRAGQFTVRSEEIACQA